MTEPSMGAFFEDLARAEDGVPGQVREALSAAAVPVWVSDSAAVERLRRALVTEEDVAALGAFASQLVHIAQHTALVSIDGGAASAETGSLRLVDEAGMPLPDGLHERYVDYLFDTGRRA